MQKRKIDSKFNAECVSTLAIPPSFLASGNLEFIKGEIYNVVQKIGYVIINAPNSSVYGRLNNNTFDKHFKIAD